MGPWPAVRRVALLAARTRFGGLATAVVCAAMPWVLPGRVHVGRNVVVLHHPVPAASVHQLALPRGRVRDVRSRTARGFWDEVATWLTATGPRHGVEAGVTNVGARQDVPQLHLHLVGSLDGWVRAGVEHDPPSVVGGLAEAVADAVVRHPEGSGSFTIERDGLDAWRVGFDPVR